MLHFPPIVAYPFLRISYTTFLYLKIMKVDEEQHKGLNDPILLEQIDKLFACNAGEHVNLPQLAVVGDQSSGRSSVLAVLMRLPFPRLSQMRTQLQCHPFLYQVDSLCHHIWFPALGVLLRNMPLSLFYCPRTRLHWTLQLTRPTAKHPIEITRKQPRDFGE